MLAGDLKEIIVGRLAKRLPDCPFVFHRGGKPIKSFAKAFKTACESVGLKGIVPHDMRRSAVRNLRRAGNDEHDCMEISGHKTRAILTVTTLLMRTTKGGHWSDSRNTSASRSNWGEK